MSIQRCLSTIKIRTTNRARSKYNVNTQSNLVNDKFVFSLISYFYVLRKLWLKIAVRYGDLFPLTYYMWQFIKMKKIKSKGQNAIIVLTLKIFCKPLWIFWTDMTIPPPRTRQSWFCPLRKLKGSFLK